MYCHIKHDGAIKKTKLIQTNYCKLLRMGIMINETLFHAVKYHCHDRYPAKVTLLIIISKWLALTLNKRKSNESDLSCSS